MKVDVDTRATAISGGGSVADAVRPDGSDAVDALAADLVAVDRLMAQLIRRLGDAAGSVSGGLPAGRAVALLAAATGMHLNFLQRVVDTLRPMPLLSQAFQHGRVSWSQIRGVVMQVDRLPIDARAELDRLLADEIAAARTGEPDRIVEVAGDLAFRLTQTPDSTAEVTDLDRNVVIGQPTLLGRMKLFADVDIETGSAVMEAIDLLADPPVAADDESDDAVSNGLARNGDDPACDGDGVASTDGGERAGEESAVGVDDDGRPVPARWAPVRNRGTQRAEGLYRLAQLALCARGATAGRSARAAVTVIVDQQTLFGVRHGLAGGPAEPQLGHDHSADTATARILWRLAGGRARLSTLTARRIACDATLIPMLTDGAVPTAAGPAHTPVTTAMRDALTARDQGCRFPGCRAPAQWTDAHHVIPQAEGGPTALDNLVLLCRRCHTRVHGHNWRQTLREDGSYTVRHGRHHHTSRPRLDLPTPAASSAHPGLPPERPAR